MSRQPLGHQYRGATQSDCRRLIPESSRLIPPWHGSSRFRAVHPAGAYHSARMPPSPPLSPRAGARWSRRRLAITVGVWSLFALLQTVVEMIAWPSGGWTFWGMLLADQILALVWIVLTPAIAAYTSFVDRTANRPLHALAAHVIGILACSGLDTAWRRMIMAAFGDRFTTPFAATMLYFVDFAVMVYLAVAVVARALDAHTQHTVKARRELRLRAQVAAARLQYLEEQLRP